MAANVRDLESRIERVPAVPGALHVLREYKLQAAPKSDFEQQWTTFARKVASQSGCTFVRLHCNLHHDLSEPSHYLSDEAWQSRSALIRAQSNFQNAPGDSDFPNMGRTSLTYVQLVRHISGRQADVRSIQPGQVVSYRVFSVKVGFGGQFERLWTQSAKAEVHQEGCLFKRLYRDLNLPTRYVSYSLWATAAAPEEAAAKHTHWQSQHPPYPLASAVMRAYLEIKENVVGNTG